MNEFSALTIRGICLPAMIGFVYLSLTACTTVNPRQTVNPDSSITPETFSHEAFDQTLQTHVNDLGRVDYASLKNDSARLEQYYQQIASYSPDSHPALFPNSDYRLAYWINAYNASVMKIVTDYYPITGVGDIRPPAPLFFLPGKWGFFIFHKPRFGNVNTSLYYLENNVIRERFIEPRVHFALNCASIGCPHLPPYAFTGEKLQQQLDQEARKFLAEERNFRIDHEKSQVFLSSIMDWYEGDFVAWLEKHHPQMEANLLNYVALYVDDEHAEELQRAANYEIEFVPYDWGLNDQNPIAQR